MDLKRDHQNLFCACAREYTIAALVGLAAAALVLLPVLAMSAQGASAEPSVRAKAIQDLKRRDKKARRKAASKLGRLGNNVEAEAELVKALRSRDRELRLRAIRSIGMLRGKKAVKRLKKLARSKDAAERELALEALSRIGTRDSVAPTTSACKKGSQTACRSLQHAQDADSLSALKTALESEDPAIRSAAAFALARRGENEGLREIAEALLTDPNAEVRTEAVHTLGILAANDPGILSVLEAALSSETNDLTLQVLSVTIKKLKR
ncbi:MAG: HEAT repeat domain-containing protein [Elusimicrobiota bacterium]